MRFPILFLAVAFAVTGCADSETKIQKRAARIHAAAYTVDSHTDTPLRIGRDGFDFGVRNDPEETRSKIDLPRMKEGGMDGIWFAVFVGQGERTPEGNAKANQRAMDVTEVIYETVEQFPEDLEVATEADDLARIAKKRKTCHLHRDGEWISPGQQHRSAG